MRVIQTLVVRKEMIPVQEQKARYLKEVMKWYQPGVKGYNNKLEPFTSNKEYQVSLFFSYFFIIYST